MNGGIATRLNRLEATAKAKPRARTPSERRAAVALVVGVEAALVAFYLGGWQMGDDGMTCLQRGMASSTPGGCKPCFDWSLYQAERAYSGQLGIWHTVERLNAAFEAIGDQRAELRHSLGDLLDRAEEIGDPVLIGIARDYADVERVALGSG